MGSGPELNINIVLDVEPERSIEFPALAENTSDA